MNAPAAVISEGKSADDLLSPILVKELRQGMRARVFLLSFLLLQVFLVLLTLGNVAAQDDRVTLDTQNGFFWAIVGFALLVLMPLRGLVAVSQEVKNRTMETIMLTRLTAWRVIFGKWSALFAQGLLLVSAVLPYIVLRYFIGGEDIVSDFKWILLMLWLSALLNATSIAVSGMGNPVVRIIVLVGIIVATGTGVGNFFNSGIGRGNPWEVLAWLIVFGFFITALLFELTASGIAPISENHAIRRRLIALLFFIVAYLLNWVCGRDYTAGMALPIIVMVGICYFELSEKPRLLPRMVQTFGSRGFLGKIAGLFFMPGWPSALLFSLLVIPTTISIFEYYVPPDNRLLWPLLIFAILGSVLLPVFVCHLFWPKTNQVLLITVLYNLILTAVAGICEGFQMLTHSSVNLVLAFLPGLPVFFATQSVEDAGTYPMTAVWHLAGNSLVVLFLILGMLFECRGYYRNLFALYRSGGK